MGNVGLHFSWSWLSNSHHMSLHLTNECEGQCNSMSTQRRFTNLMIWGSLWLTYSSSALMALRTMSVHMSSSVHKPVFMSWKEMLNFRLERKHRFQLGKFILTHYSQTDRFCKSECQNLSFFKVHNLHGSASTPLRCGGQKNIVL